MVYIHGMTHAQVAEKLDMTETASRKALSRALAKLSRILA
jgi:DNA-directed RNA polymerase specialized sigma24 family protein